jgi:hypothetical protein
MANVLGDLRPASDLRSSGAKPVILVFQPDSFAVADTPEKLQAWQKLAVETFAVPQSLADVMTLPENGGTCCESGETNDCDVD